MNTPYFDNFDLDKPRNSASYNRYQQSVKEDEAKATWYEALIETLAWIGVAVAFLYVVGFFA